MTPKENERRSIDPNVNYIKKHICDRDGNQSYVFISYKSDDWEVVLHEIVYKLVKDYGLNVYFDGSFDSHNALWVNQFPDNMRDYKCKGVIAFFDDRYATSYATLMELLYSQTKKASIGKANPNGLPVVSIDLAKLTNITGAPGQRDTGLGVHTYEDGSVNVNAKNELELFTRSFKELVKRDILEESQYIWDDGDKLDAATCSQIVREIKAYKKINENYYSSGMSLGGIVDSIKNACGAEVFSQVMPSDEPEKVQVPFESAGKPLTESIPADVPIPRPGNGAGSPAPGGYRYTIFGKDYTASEREQGKLMFDAFEALIRHYPGCEEKLTQRTSVSKAENVKNPNTSESYPTYFRGCKAFEVNGQKYLVGTSYGFKAKISEIKGMFKICGADLSEFILNGEPLGAKGSISPQREGHGGDRKGAVRTFEYELWNIPHSANSLATMMHDVFDLVAEKYASSIPDMADNDSITSVARKSDVDGGILPPNKLNYFTAKKEHIVGGTAYYVSTRYNREQGIGQLEKMLALCEGNSEAFQIKAVPDKSVKSAKGKKGIEELI